MWLNFNIKEIATGNKRKSNRQTVINITNSKNENGFIEYKNIKNGWNSIDITNLMMKIKNRINENNVTTDVLIIKCNKECLIEINNNNNNNTKSYRVPILFLNKQQYPLLQFSRMFNENKTSKEKQINIQNEQKVKKRDKRESRSMKMGDDYSENESVSYHVENESPIGANLCKNNVGHPNQECCLVSHYVSFSALKWSNWVIAPAGYRANFCIGRCSSSKGTSISVILLLRFKL